MQTQKPTLELLTCEGAYRDNPTALFHQLCGDRPATLLLESADIDSKDDLKSLLLVDSALRITVLGDTVTIQALSGNGKALLALLDNALPAGVESEQSPNCRVLRFPPVSPLLDEDARLCSLSVFDAFRSGAHREFSCSPAPPPVVPASARHAPPLKTAGGFLVG